MASASSLQADPEHARSTFLEWHPHGVARPARVGDAAVHVDRHRPLQHVSRSDPVVDEWWLLAQTEIDGDGQARRARRVDLQLLRRLGPELHVLDRRTRTTRSAGSTRRRAIAARTTRSTSRSRESREWYRPNPPLPTIKWGPRNNVNMQQSALLIAMNYVAQQRRDVPRELLPEEQAHGRARQGAGAVRVRDPGGAAAPRRGGGADEPSPASGSRGSHGQRRLDRGQYKRRRRRLRRPHGSAVRRAHRHPAGHAVLSAGESAAVRRYRLEHSAVAQRDRHQGGRQGHPDPADDARRRRTSACRARSAGPATR